MPESLVTVAYLVAGVLFILSLGGLSHQRPRGAATSTASSAWSSPCVATAFGTAGRRLPGVGRRHGRIGGADRRGAGRACRDDGDAGAGRDPAQLRRRRRGARRLRRLRSTRDAVHAGRRGDDSPGRDLRRRLRRRDHLHRLGHRVRQAARHDPQQAAAAARAAPAQPGAAGACAVLRPGTFVRRHRDAAAAAVGRRSSPASSACTW